MPQHTEELEKKVEPTDLGTADKAALWRQFQTLCRSGAVPKFINTPERLFMAYKLLTPLGLDWAVNLRNLWINEKTQSFELCNDAPLAACQKRRDEYVATVEYQVNAKGEKRTVDNFMDFEVAGAVCIAKRKGREDCVGLFTMKEAQAAQLTSKRNWQTFPAAMLTKRARAIALRQQWSDVLQGVGIYEADDYVGHTKQQPRNVAQDMLGAPASHEPDATRGVVDASFEDAQG